MSKTYEETVRENNEKEDRDRAEVERIRESRGDIGRWFAGLQKTLSDAGWDVDLSSPSDLTRLLIVDTQKKDDDAFDITTKYAFDTQQREFDPKSISGEGWESSFDPVPSPKILHQLYTAAQNGTLILMDHARHVPYNHPVQIRANGPEVSLSDPIDQLSEQEADATAILKKPVEPSKPSLFDRFLALFGNKKAKAAVEKYGRAYARYTDKMRLWEKSEKVRTEHPDVYEDAMKKFGADQIFFGNGLQYGEKLFAHQKRASELHQALVNEKIGCIDEKYRQTQAELRELLNRKADPEVSRSLADKLAELSCLADMKKKTGEALAGRSQAAGIQPYGKAFSRAVMNYKRTDEYGAVLKAATPGDLMSIADADDIRKSMKELGDLQKWANESDKGRRDQTEKEYFTSLKKNLSSTAYAVFVSSEQRKDKYPDLGIDTTRYGLDEVALSLMLADDRYSVDDVFDPDKLQDVKKEFGRKAIEMIRKEQAQEIVDSLVNGMDKINRKVGDILNHLPDLEFRTLAHPRCAHLGGMASALKGMYQNVNDIVSKRLMPKGGEIVGAEQMRYKDEIAGKSNLLSTFCKGLVSAGELVDFAGGEDFNGLPGEYVDQAIKHKAKSDVFRKMINDPENLGKDTLDMLLTVDEKNEIGPTDYGVYLLFPKFGEKTEKVLFNINDGSNNKDDIEATRKFVKDLLTDQFKFTVVKNGDTYLEETEIPEISAARKRQKAYVTELKNGNAPAQQPVAPVLKTGK